MQRGFFSEQFFSAKKRGVRMLWSLTEVGTGHFFFLAENRRAVGVFSGAEKSAAAIFFVAEKRAR